MSEALLRTGNKCSTSPIYWQGIIPVNQNALARELFTRCGSRSQIMLAPSPRPQSSAVRTRGCSYGKGARRRAAWWERSGQEKRESQCLAAHPIPGFYKAFSHPETTHTFPTQIPPPRQRFQSCDPARNMRQGWNTKSARTSVRGDEPDFCKAAKRADRQAETHQNLHLSLPRSGRTTQLRKCFERRAGSLPLQPLPSTEH